MKKIRITIIQELELPDECVLVEGIETKLINLKNLYIAPTADFMQSDTYSKKEMKFTELDDEIMDMMYGALSLEKFEIEEI